MEINASQLLFLGIGVAGTIAFMNDGFRKLLFYLASLAILATTVWVGYGYGVQVVEALKGVQFIHPEWWLWLPAVIGAIFLILLFVITVVKQLATQVARLFSGKRREKFSTS